MKKIIKFVSIIILFSTINFSCKDGILENTIDKINVESKSEIENIENTNKVKLFKKSIIVSDKEGTNSVTLLVASANENQLNDFVGSNQLTIETFRDKNEFQDKFISIAPAITNEKLENNDKSESINNILIEVSKKTLELKTPYFALHVKAKKNAQKNAKIAYTYQTEYFSSDGASNGWMAMARSPYGSTSVYTYIGYSFARRNSVFSGYGTVFADNFVTAPYFVWHNYSYRGRLRVNYDSSLDYYVNF